MGAMDDRDAPPNLLACASHSGRLLAQRLGVQVALGAAVVLSLVSVCCGIGVVMAPWMLCELTAVQLGEALGQAVPHRRSWIGASAILFGAVLLTASVAWLTWLGLGTEAGPAHPFTWDAPALRSMLNSGAGLAVASGLGSLFFVLPFLYAPVILIEARAGLGGAVLESARLVARGGVLPHLGLSLAINGIQVAPLLAGSALALQADSAAAPLLALGGLLLMSISVPFGQGMLVSAYVARRSGLADADRTRVAGRPPRALAAALVMLVAAPVVSFGLLGASLVRPSRIPRGSLPPSGEPVASFAKLGQQQRVFPQGTALEIAAGPNELRVVASDGGGAGRLPLHSSAPIESMRVARVRDSYAIEITQAGKRYLTWIDRAGVRQDDDLHARLLDRVPSWTLYSMLGALFAIAGALLPVLSSLAELRRLYTLDARSRPAPRAVSEQRSRTITRAVAVALLLVPVSACLLYWGARSVID